MDFQFGPNEPLMGLALSLMQNNQNQYSWMANKATELFEAKYVWMVDFEQEEK